MLSNKDADPTSENKTPSVSPGNYSPVTVYMEDSIGAVFLGILAVILLIEWMRAEARYRKLIIRREVADGNS